MRITQADVDAIVKAAKDSSFGLNDSDKPNAYQIDKYCPQDLQALSMLIVGAHHEKYDIVSLTWAALEHVSKKTTPSPE